MIGTPVSLCARATARAMTSSRCVTPSKSAAHFRSPAFTSVPWKPTSISRTNSRAIWLTDTPSSQRGTSSHHPVTLMRLTPDARETRASRSGSRPRSKVVASTIVSMPCTLARRNAAMASSSGSGPSRSGCQR